MLLRIDAYPHYDGPFEVSRRNKEGREAINKNKTGGKDSDNDNELGGFLVLKSSLKPLYTCLATSASNDQDGDGAGSNNGRLLVVGRKQGDIVLKKDKSVSREHCVLKCISTNEAHRRPIEDDSNNDNGNKKKSSTGCAIEPSSKDEIQACENSTDDGMCIVLENFAKFGTFVVMRREKSGGNGDSDSENDDGDSSTGGDETEEEGKLSQKKPLQQNSGVALSDVTKQLIGGLDRESDHYLKRLEPKESCVLTMLNTQTVRTATNNESGNRVIIQCGQNGSTLIITRIPLRIAFSRLDKKTNAFWNERLFSIGACTYDYHQKKENDNNSDKRKKMTKSKAATTANVRVDTKTTSHIVTKEQSPVAKQLLGWCYQIPIVSAQFLQAMIERSIPNDPLPIPEKYRPDNYQTLQTDKKSKQKQKSQRCGSVIVPNLTNSFWKVIPNPKLWAGLVLLSTSQTHVEMEQLVQAAGCTVIQLHAHRTNKEVDNDIKYFLEKQEENPTKHSLFTINARNKIIDKLKKHSDAISFVAQKSIAKYLCDQKALVDSLGNSLGANTTAIDANMNCDSVNDANDGMTDISIVDVNTLIEVRKENIVDISEEIDDSNKKRFQNSCDESISSQNANKKRKQNSSRDHSLQFDVDDTENDSINETQDLCKSNNDMPINSVSKLSLSQSRENFNKNHEMIENVDRQLHKQDHHIDEESFRGKKKSLKEMDDLDEGKLQIIHETDDNTTWLTVKPKNDKKRRAIYKQKMKKIILQRQQENSTQQEIPNVVASTYACSNLVVVKKNRASTVLTSRLNSFHYFNCSNEDNETVISATGKGVVDFKRFRKNCIVKSSNAQLRSIELRSVLPKETEKQRDMTEQRRLLEEQQRITDELFNHADTIKSSAKRKTKKNRFF